MKIQCNVCEAAEANVLCCADEATLCWGCDRKVHAANKLANKHQRVPLSDSSSKMPNCDICQEAAGYFFCLEDRALLCRKCDFAIHSSNSLVSAHQRFLLTGVKVGLEACEAGMPSCSSDKTQTTTEKMLEVEPHSLPKRTPPVSSASSKTIPVQASLASDFGGGSSTGAMSQWQLDEFVGLGDLTESYNFMDNGSSKANTGKLGDSNCSKIKGAADGELEGDQCVGQVPDSFWSVPQIISPPTSSGLYWSKNYQNTSDYNVFVPDISSFEHHDRSDLASSKRMRYF